MEFSTVGIETELTNVASAIGTFEVAIQTLGFLAVCVIGSIVGWRKILPGLVLFALIEWFNDGGDSTKIVQLIAVVVAWWVVASLVRKIKSKFKKAKTPDAADATTPDENC